MKVHFGESSLYFFQSLASGMTVHDFSPIEMIEPGKSVEVTLGVDFHDTTQGAKMEILWETEVESKKQSVTINAPIGELIRPVTMSESLFIAEQGECIFSSFVSSSSGSVK
jgi:hypothetical protein